MHTCPYCLSPISESDERATCDTCGTLHHAECMLDNGGCATKGCERSALSEPLEIAVEPARLEITVEDEPRTMLVLSKEAVEQASPLNVRKQTSNPCMRCGAQLPEGELYCRECTPELNENQDARNLGPILIMVGVIALLVWFVVLITPAMQGSSQTDSTPSHGQKQDHR
jgi:predicted nucleic acid-binding Zn ribbon protein